MSTKIPTLLAKIDSLPNKENAAIISDFHKYMQDKGSSENHIINNIKVILDLAGFLGSLRYHDIEKKEQILSFLNLKIKDSKQDPENRWITTWNHYLNRTKLFYRWFYNAYRSQERNGLKEIQDQLEWITPDFVRKSRSILSDLALIVKQKSGNVMSCSNNKIRTLYEKQGHFDPDVGPECILVCPCLLTYQ